MFLVEEVCRVSGIELRGLEFVPLTQDGAGPLPDAAHLSLARKAIAAIGHGYRVPMVETDVGTIEVAEQLRGLGTSVSDPVGAVG